MQGVHYVIDKLGQALASAENEIESLRKRLAEVESRVKTTVSEMPAESQD